VWVRKVPIALDQLQFLWRQDALRGSVTFNDLLVYMKTEALSWSLSQLRYIGCLFENEQDGQIFQVRPLNAWADGTQEGYGSLASRVPLAVSAASTEPAIVAANSRMNLSPGVHRFP
jgi:hypothetical protein